MDYNCFEHLRTIPPTQLEFLGVPHPFVFVLRSQIAATGILSRKIIVVALSRETSLSRSTVSEREGFPLADGYHLVIQQFAMEHHTFQWVKHVSIGSRGAEGMGENHAQECDGKY